MTGKIDWSAVETLIADGGYVITASLSDSDACLSLIALNLLTNPDLWSDYTDFDDIETVVDAAIAKLMGPHELVFNSHFADNIDGWFNTNWDSMYWDAHTMHLIESTAPYCSASQNCGIEVGVSYDYRLIAERISGGNIRWQQGSNTTIVPLSSSGTFEGTFVGVNAGVYQGYIRVKADSSPCEWRFDEISVWKSP